MGHRRVKLGKRKHINGHECALATIARSTGHAEIIGVISAAALERNDMIYRHALGIKGLIA